GRAADADGAGRRIDRHALAGLLGDAAGDEGEGAGRHGDVEAVAATVRIVDELVDLDAGVGAEREARAVDEEDLDGAARAGGDGVVEMDRRADADLARGAADLNQPNLAGDRPDDADWLVTSPCLREL